MKLISSLLLSFLLLGCARQVEAPNAYAHLDEKLSITFLENPDISQHQCNPIIEAAYYSRKQSIPLEITLHIDVKDKRDVNVIMLPSRTPGLLIGRAPISSAEPITKSCKEIHLRLSKLDCLNAAGTETIQCPMSKKTDGLRMFGYVAVNY